MHYLSIHSIRDIQELIVRDVQKGEYHNVDLSCIRLQKQEDQRGGRRSPGSWLGSTTAIDQFTRFRRQEDQSSASA